MHVVEGWWMYFYLYIYTAWLFNMVRVIFTKSSRHYRWRWVSIKICIMFFDTSIKTYPMAMEKNRPLLH